MVRYCVFRKACVFVLPLLILMVSPARSAHDSTLWNTAQVKFEAGDLTQAATLLNQLLTQYPSSPKVPGAHLKLAEIQRLTHPDATTAESIKALSQVMSDYPSSPEAAEALMQEGFVYAKTRLPDDTQSAIDTFTTFLRSYPNNQSCAKVQQALGMLYARNRDLDKAEAALDSVRTSAGVTNDLVESSALHSGFIKIMKYYASQDRTYLTRAISALGGLTLSGNLGVKAKADLGIAEATLLLGKPLEAREHYRKSAISYSNQIYYSGIALYGIAFCSQEAGELNQAVDDYSALLSKPIGGSLAEKDINWRSACLGSTSQNTQAFVQMNGKYELIPGNDIIYQAVFNQANCMYELGRYDDAISILTDLVASLADGTDLHTRATNLLERSRNAKGAE